jgi:hypothetical protein
VLTGGWLVLTGGWLVLTGGWLVLTGGWLALIVAFFNAVLARKRAAAIASLLIGYGPGFRCVGTSCDRRIMGSLRWPASQVLPLPHPDQGDPAPDGRQVGSEQPLDEDRRGGVGLRDPGRRQA